jgi:thiol:disulfide interchange protein DsbC
VPGIFEVVAGMDVFYVDATGRYAFVEGHMLDLKETKDLTQARLEKVSSIVFKDLPFELALKTVRGNGKRKVAVFEDPNCSYCRAFRTLLNHLDDVTIYSFPYPVLSADSEAKVRSVLCAKDRVKAWDVLMSTGKPPSAAACKADVGSLVQLGQRLNVSGTPTVFFANGRRSQGAVPPDQFMAMLEEASR